MKKLHVFFLKKMGISRPLFVYFRHFLDAISIIQIEKSVDGVLGMVGAGKTTELWRPPNIYFIRVPTYVRTYVRYRLSIEASVTRLLNYLFNNLAFTLKKLSESIKIAKLSSKCFQIVNKLIQNGQSFLRVPKWQNFTKSGHTDWGSWCKNNAEWLEVFIVQNSTSIIKFALFSSCGICSLIVLVVGRWKAFYL